MNRSKQVFLILAFVYIGIAFGDMVCIFTIDESVLLGLSCSSLLITLADAIDKFCKYLVIKNDYDFSLLVTSDFLQSKISEGLINEKGFDIYNLKYNIDILRTKSNPIHPVNYGKKRVFKILYTVSIVFFVSGIASFIIIPFSQIEVNNSISKHVTVFAFAFMCGNMFLDETKNNMAHEKYLFNLDKQGLISSLFTDYMNEYNYRTQHLVSYTKTQKNNNEETDNGNN